MNTEAPEAPRAFLPALVGLALALAAVPVYILTIDDPWLRSTGAVAFALMALGTLVGLWAVGRDRRWRVRIPASLTVLLTALWVFAFCWYARLPAAGEASTMVSVSDFALPDQDGRPVRLSEHCAPGPTLLVFVRGHW